MIFADLCVVILCCWFVLSFFILMVMCFFLFFFFKQKTAYEMRISDWSSDVCSSDLYRWRNPDNALHVRRSDSSPRLGPDAHRTGDIREIGRASCRERVCQYV